MKISELPEDLKVKALEYQKNETGKAYDKETDYLNGAFNWEVTKEGYDFWDELYEAKPNEIEVEDAEIVTPKHYDNSKGTLYKVATERGWTAYLFDIVKRLERADKKGEFESDLDKSIAVIQLWKNEKR